MSSDRLTALDESFLHLEDRSAHMHVAALMLFEGDPPAYDELLEAIDQRLHLVPRYRQRLAFVPYVQARPRWVDDPHFNLSYHVRATALPAPGDEGQLKALAGRVFSQRLDRDKPLWELWVVHGLSGDRFALLSKTHHALVDGISGVDIVTVLFDAAREPKTPPAPGEPWEPRPLPSRAQLVGESLVERLGTPAGAVRAVRDVLDRPRQIAGAARDALAGLGAIAGVGIRAAPETPYNQPISSHRRFAWVRSTLADVKAIKSELGGTVNDVMLAAVAGALRRDLERRKVLTAGLELRAMVPVSVRPEDARGALGNQVAAMYAILPVGIDDARARFTAISEGMRRLKETGQAVGARALTELAGFAPPTVLSQAARLVPTKRMFNLVVTNVPGPQFSVYLMGREMLEPFPLVPLAKNQGLGVAIMSYNGRINFGLNADYELVPDVDRLAEDLADSLVDLGKAAGVAPRADTGTGEPLMAESRPMEPLGSAGSSDLS